MPSSNTRTRDALRARLTRSTSTRLPSRLERITDSGLAIGLSTRIGSALPAKLALPALVDEAEVDRLLLAERGHRVAQRARRRAAPRSRTVRLQRAARRRRRQRVVADAARITSSIRSSSIGRSKRQLGGVTVDRRRRARSTGEAEPLHHALALGLRHRHADHLGGARDAQRHRRALRAASTTWSSIGPQRVSRRRRSRRSAT